VNDVIVYENYLYAATDLGLNRIALATIGKDSLGIGEILPNLLRHIRIEDLERQENLLWAATAQGPFVYDMAQATGGYIEGEAGRASAYAVSYYDSLVWFGTSLGIDVLNVKERNWLGAPSRQSLGGAEIYCIKAGPQAVWVGTNAGVYKYHGERKAWKLYTAEDGLLDNHVNAVALDDDFVWFGTDLGVTVFRWKAFHDFE
jgi:ligand-binding sensor domain-containing protein